MNIIGISAYFHDSSCALIQDGKLVAAISEERLSRIKNDARLPIRAFRECLRLGQIDITDIDCIAYYEDPYKKLSRQLSSGFDVSSDDEMSWIDCHKPFREIKDILGYEGKISYYEHHASHAAATFFFSGFDDAAIFISDGVGEWATTSYGQGHGSRLELFNEVKYPNSVGLLYSTITNFLGFKVLNGEYKVMGLAPYGKPAYVDMLEKLFVVSSDGYFELDSRYFDFGQISRMYTDDLISLIGFSPRIPESELLEAHIDLARSLQVVLEKILFVQLTYLKSEVDSENLCMSGGVALNCVANSKIRKSNMFRDLFIPPAAGDAGSALGAAALAHIDLTGERHCNKRLKQTYLGPSYDDGKIIELLAALELDYLSFSNAQEKLIETVVNRIDNGKVVGWFQGRMEFGPRALGSRSILADPRDPSMRARLNELVKKREGFRPFAPAILNEHVAKHMELDSSSPFMLETCQVSSSLDLPAITHVDGSCRPQTVEREQNPLFYALIQAFYDKTGCPILVNTSFNVRGEPIVCTPLDALRCFGNSNIDVLVLGSYLIDRVMLPSAFKSMAELEMDAIQPSCDVFSWSVKSDGVYSFV